MTSKPKLYEEFTELQNAHAYVMLRARLVSDSDWRVHRHWIEDQLYAEFLELTE